MLEIVVGLHIGRPTWKLIQNDSSHNDLSIYYHIDRFSGTSSTSTVYCYTEF
jgi:hypothetical protein